MQYLHQGRDWFMITLGVILYVVGYVGFQLPYHITTGGVAGISALLFYSSGFPVQYSYFIMNVILLVFALRILGWKFMVNTVYAVVMITLLLGVAQDIIRLPDGTFPKYLGEQSFMACVVAAAIEGTGLGVIFLNNGSSGGTDIIAAIVSKYRDMSLGQIIMLSDFLIISCSYLIFDSVELLIYGYCTMFIETFSLDNAMTIVRQSVQFLIISEKYQEIAQKISDMNRGVTLLDGSGWYTKQPRKILMVLCRRRESTRIFRIIRSIDPSAFVSQAKVSGVFGEGFDRIKGK